LHWNNSVCKWLYCTYMLSEKHSENAALFKLETSAWLQIYV